MAQLVQTCEAVAPAGPCTRSPSFHVRPPQFEFRRSCCCGSLGHLELIPVLSLSAAPHSFWHNRHDEQSFEHALEKVSDGNLHALTPHVENNSPDMISGRKLRVYG